MTRDLTNNMSVAIQHTPKARQTDASNHCKLTGGIEHVVSLLCHYHLSFGLSKQHDKGRPRLLSVTPITAFTGEIRLR